MDLEVEVVKARDAIEELMSDRHERHMNLEVEDIVGRGRCFRESFQFVDCQIASRKEVVTPV